MIEFKNVSFSYPDGKEVIHNLSFKVENGDSVGIVGANGAGKSTLLLLLTGIFKPNSGGIWIDEVKVEKKNYNKIRKKVGMVLQNPDDSLFMATVYDDVAFAPRNHNLSEETVKANTDYAIRQMDIGHLKDRAPYRLSDGEKKRTAIAAVLSMRPQVVIFDEPTSLLDPRSRRMLIHTIKELPYTKLLTSHDLDMVKMVCNKVIVLKEGRLVAEGIPGEILNDEQLMLNSGL